MYFWEKDLKRTLKVKKELKKEFSSTNDVSIKKISRSLTNLLQVEKDLKKMNIELKKVVKKVKTLEKENSKLQKKLDKK